MANFKCLCLIRHAKSSWKNPGMADRGRPLNERGQLDAPRMGKRLALRPDRPQLIVSSPAVRAVATAELIADAIGLDPGSISVEDRIYGAGPLDLLKVAEALDDRFDRVALVGHNPAFTELACELVGGIISHMPTCSIATIGLKASEWGHIAGAPAELIDFDYPKKAS